MFLCALLFAFSGWALDIKSDAFLHQDYIPSVYTCDSSDYSPHLWWSNVPEGVKSFVLICDDPDAPSKTWIHWVIFNIPKDARSLSENIPKTGVLTDGSIQGKNDFDTIGYRGPCPPKGKPHRYFFTLYAIDTVLSLGEGVTKSEVLGAIQNHIKAKVELIGLYKR